MVKMFKLQKESELSRSYYSGQTGNSGSKLALFMLILDIVEFHEKFDIDEACKEIENSKSFLIHRYQHLTF